MFEDQIISGTPRSKSTMRTSIRHSLNLASVGKAFADVINKDSRDSSKSVKKPKDSSSRRSSAVNPKPAAPRTSMTMTMTDTKPQLQTAKRAGTPDSKTITRRRVSGTTQRCSVDEQPSSKPTDPPTPQGGGNTRTSTLRPRNLNSVASSLPKYRPKSTVIEAQKQPPSPVRVGTRRRFSSSDDDEKDDKKEQVKPSSSIEKATRPISPLPLRATLKTNLGNHNNATPPTTPTKTKIATPTSKTSPHRPTKFVKTTATSTAVGSNITRPSSSNSSSSSFTPHTPKTPVIKSASGLRRPATGNTNSSRNSQSTASPHSPSRNSPSPLAHRSRNGIKPKSPNHDSSGNMSHISEGNSEDSEAEDVELLLAPVAALGAPTPAMPRIQAFRPRKEAMPPQTPSRGASLLPTRANLSYLSPLPPGPDKSSPALRPQQPNSGERAGRGSILSWEQLATEASKTLGEDELGYMLSDIPAPFQSGAVSPSPSTHLEIPDSPCLFPTDSPGGYGSISQVLLPDVTPSPAVYHNNNRYNISPEASSVDSAAATLLRLQLASAENMAKERLYQIQAMEEEIHNLKEVHARQLQESARQLSYMERHDRKSVDEREAYITSLEDQLRNVQALHETAIQDAVFQNQDKLKRAQEKAAMRQRHLGNLSCSARVAISEWASVRDISEIELDIIRSDREVLAVLLGELNHMCSSL